MNIFQLFLGVLLLSPVTQAEELQQNVPKDTIRHWPHSIQWQDASATLPVGTQITVLEGNPKKEGMFTIRLKTPKNMRLNVHQHPGPERVTIIQGDIYVGFGDQFNQDVATKFSAGSFYINPKNKNHYVFTKDKVAIVQITGKGPWQVVYPKE